MLGSGGMGRVYRGEHTGIGRAVAIKVLHADLGRNRDAAARFQREALASGRLDHPNIVRVSDSGVLDDGACYLVMEALDGESLGQRLERERRVPWQDALAILRGVLHGLRHAHDRGVVHRDIKPDNIFLARIEGDIVVKILDFGIAKLFAGSADDPASTRAGLTVGTPAYLSPEQAVGGAIKPASDLYSATVVLFEMITGRAPFEDKDPLAMLGAHVSRTPPTIAEVAPELAATVPPPVEALIQRGLAKTVGERIGSAAEYIAAIDALIGVPTMSTPVPGSLSAPALVAASPTGSAPTVSLTPMPAGSTPPPMGATPLPGAPRPAAATAAPVEGLTAAIETIAPGQLGKRQPSLAELGPVPRRWLVNGAIVLVVLIAGAIILAVATRSKSSSDGGGPRASWATDRDGDDDGADRKTRLKALLYELEKGKDCATRRAAISKLVELGDPAAIPALKSARYRMRGGVLGIGQDNTNACLTRDAEAAIKKLSPRGKDK